MFNVSVVPALKAAFKPELDNEPITLLTQIRKSGRRHKLFAEYL
jgi:hypothetical protein